MEKGLIDHIIVFLAFLSNNGTGKQKDVHGRQYRDVYKKFGHMAMVQEYRDKNSWGII